MFTGIVENMGATARLVRRAGGARLEVRAPWLAGDLAIGESVAINGACVTVTELDHESFACDLVPETVARTNLGILEPGEEVNLERPMRAADRLGGHIVQGHIDALGLVRSRRRVGAQEMIEVTIPFELTRFLAPQGSVAIDGVSLTVVAVEKDRFRVALIPHTVASTTLGRKGQGASVNVEVDVLSKYVERHMAARASRPAILFEDAPKEPAPLPARPAPPSRPAPAPAAVPARKPAPSASRTPAARARGSRSAATRPTAKARPATKARPAGARTPAKGRPSAKARSATKARPVAKARPASKGRPSAKARSASKARPSAKTRTATKRASSAKRAATRKR